ncbi:SacI homology domain-containing protein [Pisolithus orientalis]|uniref:SacI homology domain-containing protein n=1 Tax=Pisolithus orientalis TaxID=936130 RepID=UPI0022255AF2|nr:SacI homology domain-containing protein [Pisolithus orientalis]KAI6005178.1 SacI homology domain-containing protein [Pisolithus orientalis]
MKPVYQRLSLFFDGEAAYTFVPIEPLGAQSLTIHRATGDIVLNPPNKAVPSTATRYEKTVYGILGMISLALSEYVVIMTGREHRARFLGHDIYRAADFDILPLNPSVSVQYPSHPVEGHLLALVRAHLFGGYFLFSYTFDLSRRLQAQWNESGSDATRPLWEQADDRFFWNKFLQSRLIDTEIAQDLSPYILPIVYGTFDLRTAYIHGHKIQLCLISRRSRYRAGTRYFRRGIDHQGHVANFNETEQIVLVEESAAGRISNSEIFTHKLSFVQTRGSVPVFWGEINTLRYKPDLQIMDLQDTVDAMRLHLKEQISLYGEQCLINLVNQKGYEQPVKEAYERIVAQTELPEARYRYFDFHNECKHMRWNRINILIERLQEDLLNFGYFHLNMNTSQVEPAVKLQNGVVRTNCMDNLDRTNVVQAALAKWTLNYQLKSLGVLTEGEELDDFQALSQDFREIWADHADLISRAYAGSGALKTDFTRTNKRTKLGLLEDGYKSVMRYIKNNYFDGTRQDGFDLVTGAWTPRKNPITAVSLLADTRPLIIRSVPYIASFSLFMICAGLTLPRTSDYSLLYYFMLWFMIAMLSIIFIMLHGIEYVSWPRLIPPTDIIHYNGPGFRSAHHGKGLMGPLGKRFATPRKAIAANGIGRKRAPTNYMEEIEKGTKSRVD